MWRSNFSILPALMVAALPKCPLCLMGLMSIVGLGSLIQASWLFPLTLVLMGTCIGTMILRARRRRNYYAFCLSVVSAAVIIFGKFQVDYPPLTFAGVAMLICASLWNNWPKKRVVDETGCDC